MTTALIGTVIVTSPGSPSTNVTSPSGGTIFTTPGVPGPAGSGVNLAGAVLTYEDLPNDLGVSDAGKAYVVQGANESDPAAGKLYVWSGTAWPPIENGADFRGEQGTPGRGIDDISISGNILVFSMSDSSTDNVTVPAIAAANTAAINAANSASAASTSATNASNSATAASSSASTATTQAGIASTAATNASSANTSAQTAKTDAQTAATAASNSATNALSYKNSAETAATAAGGAATSASTSASTASTAATTATTARDAAISAQDNAETSAESANTSAINAAASETSAASSETNASASAAAASTSATNAGTYASNASDSADLAEYWAGEAADTVSTGIPDATTSNKGGVKLSSVDGEVGGTFDHLTVNGWASKADLGLDGKLLSSQIPQLAILDIRPVADTAERLALTDIQTGDIAIQYGNPGRGTYILVGSDPSDSGDWLIMPVDVSVSSVNSYTGIVVLTKTDVGLSNVNNTSDANKPVSTATQTALDGKVPTTRTITAGTGLNGGGDFSADRTLSVAYGTTATTAAVGNDSRIVNATPNTRTFSAGTGLTGGGDFSANRTFAADFGSAAGKVCEGNDSRLSDTRTPTDNSVTSAKIVDGTITNTDINASAAIAATQLATGVQTSLGKADTAIQQAGLDSAIATAQQVAINSQTGTTYTLVLADASKAVECSNAGAIALTVPTNASVAFPVGTVIEITQIGAGQVTVGAAGGVTINQAGGLKTRAQWSSVILRKRATDTWLLTGDSAA